MTFETVMISLISAYVGGVMAAVFFSKEQHEKGDWVLYALWPVVPILVCVLEVVSFVVWVRDAVDRAKSNNSEKYDVEMVSKTVQETGEADRTSL